jgi:hypothetical protein
LAFPTVGEAADAGEFGGLGVGGGQAEQAAGLDRSELVEVACPPEGDHGRDGPQLDHRHLDRYGHFLPSLEEHLTEALNRSGRAAAQGSPPALASLAAEWPRSSRFVHGHGLDEQRPTSVIRLAEHLLSTPVISAARVADLLGVTRPTAYAAIDTLVDRGDMIEITGKERRRIYRAPAIFDAVYGRVDKSRTTTQ